MCFIIVIYSILISIFLSGLIVKTCAQTEID